MANSCYKHTPQQKKSQKCDLSTFLQKSIIGYHRKIIPILPTLKEKNQTTSKSKNLRFMLET